MVAEKDKTDRLITLNKVEVGIGIIVGIATLASLAGAYWILPYRMATAEAAMLKLEARIEVVEKSNRENHDVLIRIDERLKTVQDRLRIPNEDRPAK